jgi:mono/diheme cytochrome c family protein
MNKLILVGGATLALAVGYAVMQSVGVARQADTAPPEPGAAIVAVTLPDSLSTEAQRGKQAFDAVCAACHGADAAGKMGSGPPLVHKIYEPSHHGDQAFFLAAQQGVKAHHWPFGNMPPQDGLTRADLAGIVAYVRELQRFNGIN